MISILNYLSISIGVSHTQKFSIIYFLFADMKEEEIEVKDMKENPDMGGDEPGEDANLLENGNEENPVKDGGQDQDMPKWRLPR